MSLGPSAAEEKLDLFEEPLGSWLMFQEHMVLALERDESRAANACRQRTAALDRIHDVSSRVNYQGGHRHSGEKIANVEIAYTSR